jgi:hypothetical protein
MDNGKILEGVEIPHKEPRAEKFFKFTGFAWIGCGNP